MVSSGTVCGFLEQSRRFVDRKLDLVTDYLCNKTKEKKKTNQGVQTEDTQDRNQRGEEGPADKALVLLATTWDISRATLLLSLRLLLRVLLVALGILDLVGDWLKVDLRSDGRQTDRSRGSRRRSRGSRDSSDSRDGSRSANDRSRNSYDRSHNSPDLSSDASNDTSHGGRSARDVDRDGPSTRVRLPPSNLNYRARPHSAHGNRSRPTSRCPPSSRRTPSSRSRVPSSRHQRDNRNQNRRPDRKGDSWRHQGYKPRHQGRDFRYQGHESFTDSSSNSEDERRHFHRNCPRQRSMTLVPRHHFDLHMRRRDHSSQRTSDSRHLRTCGSRRRFRHQPSSSSESESSSTMTMMSTSGAESEF